MHSTGWCGRRKAESGRQKAEGGRAAAAGAGAKTGSANGRRRAGRVPAPTTSLVGREQDIESVTLMALDDKVRLITLLGAAGSGKTRLGQEVAL